MTDQVLAATSAKLEAAEQLAELWKHTADLEIGGASDLEIAKAAEAEAEALAVLLAKAADVEALEAEQWAADLEAVTNVIKLDHNIAFYVPSTVQIDLSVSDLEAAKRAEDIAAAMADLFGGATIYPDLIGAWLDSNGRLILEKITKVTSFATAADVAQHYDRLLALAAEKRRTWKQESIALEVDNSLILV
jgi:hypothetical protein